MWYQPTLRAGSITAQKLNWYFSWLHLLTRQLEHQTETLPICFQSTIRDSAVVWHFSYHTLSHLFFFFNENKRHLVAGMQENTFFFPHRASRCSPLEAGNCIKHTQVTLTWIPDNLNMLTRIPVPLDKLWSLKNDEGNLYIEHQNKPVTEVAESNEVYMK